MVMVFWIVETVKSCPACVVCPISTISGDDDGDGDGDGGESCYAVCVVRPVLSISG